MLPPVLPDGVFFVVTSREQHDDGLYADHVWEIVIADDDPRNVADLRAFTRRWTQAASEASAAWSAALKLSSDELIEHLVDRSEGNFQYLRLVLADMAAGEEPGELPRGLERYYRRHWNAMQARSEDEYVARQRPVLCYLATAREPVTVGDLAEWTGLPKRQVGTTCTGASSRRSSVAAR